MLKPTYKALLKGRVSIVHQIYHVRICSFQRKKMLHNLFLARTIILSLKKQSHLCKTLSFVVMPDHIHWLVQIQSPDVSISEIVRRVKISVSKIFGSPIWQDGFYERAIRREEDVISVSKYIIRNPIRAGLVASVKDYSHWDAVYF